MKNNKKAFVWSLQIFACGAVLTLVFPSISIFAQESIMNAMQPISSQTGAKNRKMKGRAAKGTAYHHALSVDHNNGMEHSKALYHYAATDASINLNVAKNPSA